MAKGLSLTDSSVDSFYMGLDGSGDADVRCCGKLYDDQGEFVKQVEVDTKFSALPGNMKAHLNRVLRLMGKDFKIKAQIDDVMHRVIHGTDSQNLG
jgi:hypothetical protein